MFALERQKMIIELLNQEGAVSVSRLSDEMGVTEETVRRDLEKLEQKELLRRTHGGALPIEEGSNELSLNRRKTSNVESKQKIVRAAVTLIATGDTIFLDASTTTFFIAKELKRMKQAVTVITNSIRVIDELADCDSVKLIGVGGLVGNNQSFIGRFAENSIEENYFANKMFFSSKGIVRGSGVLESNEQECAVKQQMFKNSKKHYYLCDKTKVGRIGFIKLADIENLAGIITDAEIDKEWKSELQELGVKLIKC